MCIGDKNKAMSMYHPKGKIEALKAAYLKALQLIEALVNKLGHVRCIVKEKRSIIFPFAQSNVNVSSSDAASLGNFRIIKESSSILVRFEMQISHKASQKTWTNSVVTQLNQPKRGIWFITSAFPVHGLAHLPTSFFNRSPVHWSALHVPTLPLFPATVLKIDHRIGPVPDKAVIPLSVEFGFQFILGFFLYFSPHQPITVFHSVVLQLLHAFSQTNIKTTGNETVI